MPSATPPGRRPKARGEPLVRPGNRDPVRTGIMSPILDRTEPAPVSPDLPVLERTAPTPGYPDTLDPGSIELKGFSVVRLDATAWLGYVDSLRFNDPA